MITRWISFDPSEAEPRTTVASVLIAGISILLVGASLLDVWIDFGLEDKPLWSTILENLLPFLIGLGLPYTAWRIHRTYRRAYYWTVAVWITAGFGAALVLSGITLGSQVFQGELKPRIILLQIASGGAAAGLLIGRSMSEMGRTREELERDKLFDSLKQSVLEGIVITDQQGTIIDWNRGAQQIFGYKNEEIVGRPIETLFAEPHKTSVQDDLKRIGPSEKSPRNEKTLERKGVHKSTEEIPLELSLSTWQTAGERYFAAIIRDISERRELQREILRVQEEERKNIGQDLHDGVASQLTGANLKLNLLSESAEQNEIRQEIEEIQSLIKESASDVRRLSRGLNPKGLDEGDLPSALKWLCENTDRAHFESPTDLPSFSDVTATHLYRIAQEATRNAQKYAEAENIRICLRREEDMLFLNVEDDGRGFDPDEIQKKGVGLRSMHHRAELLGAELDVESSPGDGTLVRCRVPLSKPVSA